MEARLKDVFFGVIAIVVAMVIYDAIKDRKQKQPVAKMEPRIADPNAQA